MRTLGVSVLVGAMLSGNFRSTVGAALGGLGEMDKGMSGLQRRLLDIGQAWAGMHTLQKFVVGASDQQHELEQIGITADMTAAQVETLRQGLRDLSAPGQTNQTTDDLVKAYKALASAGLTDRIKDQTAMLTVMRSVGRTATAATADIEDMSKTAFVLVDTLGVAPDALASELDRLAFAGKKGSFELKDMARYFPQLGAAAKEAGLAGTEGVATLGAALQIARKGTGDASEAATNTANFFQKMMSKETIKNLKDHNVDVLKLMTDARKQGKNPMVVYMEALDKLLGDGSTAEGAVKRQARLGAIFADAQVQNFIRPMLSNLDQFKSMLGEVKGASGTVDKDYARITNTFKEQSKAATTAMENLGDSIGRSLMPPLGSAMALATPVITWMAGVANKSPGTAAAIAAVGGAMMILPPVISTVTWATRTMNLAMLANPVGLLVAGLAIGAGLIYDNWEPIKGFFLGLWDDAKPKWDAFADFITDWATMVAAPIRMVIELGKAAWNFMQSGNLDMSGVQQAQAEAAAAGGRMWNRVAGDTPMPELGTDTKAMAAAGAAPKGQVDVNVKVDGLPRGSQVETNTQGGGVGNVDTYTGFQMGAP